MSVTVSRFTCSKGKTTYYVSLTEIILVYMYACIRFGPAWIKPNWSLRSLTKLPKNVIGNQTTLQPKSSNNIVVL